MDDVNEENADARTRSAGAQEARRRRHGRRGVLRVGAVGADVRHVLWRPFKDEEDEAAAPDGQGCGSERNNSADSNAHVVVAQPVVEDEDEDAVIGTEPVVAISMPLLSIH